MKQLIYSALLGLTVCSPLSVLYAGPSQQAPPPQTTVVAPPVTAPPKTTSVSPRQYRVGPDDTIKVDFIGIDDENKEMNRNYLVQSNGAIEIKLLNTVKVEGLTTLQIADLLASLLVKGGLYEPGRVQPSVSMAEYRDFEVQVGGAVRTPSVIRLSGENSSVSRAISLAGGFASNAGNEVEVIRAPVPDQPTQVIVVTKDQLDMNDDPGLAEGDRINVKLGRVFSVNGEVNAKGEKTWSPGMTVARALVLAGGQTDKFSMRRSHISRPVKDKDGKVLKYEKIDGLKPETPVLPDDILVAGRSWM
jgi:protein involved in polysaccharide export with SLBB domain